jgi:hypothetical protein
MEPAGVADGGSNLLVMKAFRNLATLLTLVSFIGGLAACSGNSAGPGSDLPPVAASPEQVARIYLNAAVARHCVLTRELTTGTWSWCNDPRLLGYRSVSKAYHVPASEAGRSEECVDFVMHTHGSSDGTMPIGWQPWGLCFVRTRAGWRLYDQGQG